MSSYFLDNTPVLEVIVKNPIMGKSFPNEGTVIAVLDTGFEGFLLVPETVFKELSFDQFSQSRDNSFWLMPFSSNPPGHSAKWLFRVLKASLVVS